MRQANSQRQALSPGNIQNTSRPKPGARKLPSPPAPTFTMPTAVPRNLVEQNSASMVTAMAISPPSPKPTTARPSAITVKLGAIAQMPAPSVNSSRSIDSITRRP
ncbi:hypothetical protein FQZ97_641110 [compost metagenome]